MTQQGQKHQKHLIVGPCTFPIESDVYVARVAFFNAPVVTLAYGSLHRSRKPSKAYAESEKYAISTLPFSSMWKANPVSPGISPNWTMVGSFSGSASSYRRKPHDDALRSTKFHCGSESGVSTGGG